MATRYTLVSAAPLVGPFQIQQAHYGRWPGIASVLLALASLAATLASAQTSAAPLSISGTPSATAPVATEYRFTPSVSGGNGTRRNFKIRGKPTWASFDGRTGSLVGTPATSQVGDYANIRISVTDGRSSAALPAFSIRVTTPATTTSPPTPTTTNIAPTISGTPATTATVGQPYSFQPTGSDANGDSIAFGIANKPAWASFSTATGRLSGTPTSADVGTHPNIVIAVSDTKANATLAPFSIVVNQIATGSVTVSWTPPTNNVDGTPLIDLAGYRILYGTSPTALTQSIELANPGLTRYVLANLGPGTWYISVAAYNQAGASSDPSNVANKTVL
jgi:hypothetical protein